MCNSVFHSVPHDLLNRKIHRLRRKRPVDQTVELLRQYIHSHNCVWILHTFFYVLIGTLHVHVSLCCLPLNQHEQQLQPLPPAAAQMLGNMGSVWKGQLSPNQSALDMKRKHAPSRGWQFPQFPLSQREALIWWVWHRTKTHNWHGDGNQFNVHSEDTHTHPAAISLKGSTGHTIAAINFDNRMCMVRILCVFLCVYV